MTPYRVLITGSRTWDDMGVIAGVLAGHYREGAILVSGACPRGADVLAEEYWALLGGQVERHPASWSAYGKRAGYVRNAQMVNAGADVCACFLMPCADSRCTRPRPHDSHGGSQCAGLARAAGIPTEVYRAGTGKLTMALPGL